MQLRPPKVFLVVSTFLLTSAMAAAEIEKQATVGDHGLNFYWWPKLTPPAGWRHDNDVSLHLKANVLIPRGKRFDNAETVIYARAFYEPDAKKRGTLKEFITDDLKGYKEAKPKLIYKEIAPIPIAKGKPLRTYSFTDPGVTFEQVAYGGEGDFWIEFVISSKTESGLKRDLPLFRKLLSTYK